MFDVKHLFIDHSAKHMSVNVEKQHGGRRTGAGRKKEEVAADLEESGVSVCREFVWQGGSKRLFAEAEQSPKPVRMFGGVEIAQHRKTKTSNPPACGFRIVEAFRRKTAATALTAAGLYRAAEQYHFDKDQRPLLVKTEERKRKFAAARDNGILPEGAPDDGAILFDAPSTISTIEAYIKSPDGSNTANYAVGKADAALGLYDTRLMCPRGIPGLSRPFRSYLCSDPELDNSADKTGWGGQLFDVDLANAYPTISLNFARAIDMDTPFLSSYVQNTAEWRRNITGIKNAAIVAHFYPDCTVPASEKCGTPVDEAWRVRAEGLIEEIRGLALVLVSDEDLKENEEAFEMFHTVLGDGKTPVSLRGSILSRLYARPERSLVDDGIRLFKRRGFDTVAICADGFVVRATDAARAMSKEGTARAEVERLLSEIKYSGGYKFAIKQWEVPEDLDLPPKNCFDYTHPTFGKLDWNTIFSKACVSHGTYPSVYHGLSRWTLIASRCMQVVSGRKDVVFKLRGGEAGDVVRDERGALVETSKVSSSYVRFRSGFDDAVFDYVSGNSEFTMSWVKSPSEGIHKTLSLTNHHAVVTENLLPTHPEFDPKRMFSVREPALATRHEAFRTMSDADALRISEPLVYHMRHVLCANVAGSLEVLCNVLVRSILGIRGEVVLVFTGAKGGEGKTMFFEFIGKSVLGDTAFCVRSGLDWVTARFNSPLIGKSLVLCEELDGADGKDPSILKHLKAVTTASTFRAEIKGVDEHVHETNIINVIGVSNKETPIPLTAGISRRTITVPVSEKYVGDFDYMSKLSAAMQNPMVSVALGAVLCRGLIAPVQPLTSPLRIPQQVLASELREDEEYEALPLREKVIYMHLAAMIHKAGKAWREVGPMETTYSDIFENANRYFNLRTDVAKDQVSVDTISKFLRKLGVPVTRKRVGGERERVITFVLYPPESAFRLFQPRYLEASLRTFETSFC